ncbi:MAG: hypothetical protein ABIO63_00080 [Casimicrobiaceae bacterium]
MTGGAGPWRLAPRVGIVHAIAAPIAAEAARAMKSARQTKPHPAAALRRS